MMFTKLQIQQIKTIAACHGYTARFHGTGTVSFNTWATLKKEALDDLSMLNIHLEDYIDDVKDGGGYQFNRIAYTLKEDSNANKYTSEIPLAV